MLTAEELYDNYVSEDEYGDYYKDKAKEIVEKYLSDNPNETISDEDKESIIEELDDYLLDTHIQMVEDSLDDFWYEIRKEVENLPEYVESVEVAKVLIRMGTSILEDYVPTY